jgi:PAS domain S-box-containing protein
VIGSGGDTDPRVLGQLLAAQSTFSILPTGQGMGEFVSRAMERVPGVTSCVVCLAGAERPSFEGELAPECADCDLPRGDIDQDPGHPCRLRGSAALRVIPLRTQDRHFGFLLVQVEEPEQYAPYDPFVGNLADSLTVNLERQRQKDLAERRTIELKEGEELFRTAAESLTDVVYQWDLKERIDWHGDIDSLTGYPPGGFPRSLGAFMEVVDPVDRDAVTAAIAAELEGVSRYRIEYRIRQMDGTSRWWAARGTALRDAQDTPRRWIGSITDITERRRADEALESQHRQLVQTQEHLRDLVGQKSRFVATVSHELRTPLSAVLGFASELRDSLDAFSRAEVAEFAGLIASGCVTANNLVEDLLVAARLEAGDIRLTPGPIDLYRHALSAVAELGTIAWSEGKGFAVEGGPSAAWADRQRVDQILRNLVGNAARYGGNSITLITGTTTGSREAFLRVVDDGPGVTGSLLNRLFQSYQHGPQQAGRTESVGLGLYISRTLARLMAGDLTYRREAGTTIFELTLPLSDRPTNQDTW